MISDSANNGIAIARKNASLLDFGKLTIENDLDQADCFVLQDSAKETF